ncbi:Dysbindin [Acropora cervicornis]|uniref:Dysbindin n=1 Tax=Acropora cervicornis TaxID=6130 RepID=A0AAD9UX46_ACRCE|nr:Dysbindin [Acropora cervicornis]
MFDNFRDRLQAVQHDLTIGWKSITDKAKAVNKKLVRKTTFITDEIIVRYQKEWAQLHETSRECAKRAQNADQIISEFSKKCSDLHATMTTFHNELAQLPDVIKSIETVKADVEAIGGQMEVLDNCMLDLEEVCELLDLERRKAAQDRKLSMLKHNREDDLELLKEELESEKEKREVELQQLERQASIEKQQVYEDAFLEQMNYYIQHGKTEDDTELHRELDNFFGSEAEQSEALLDVDKEKTSVFSSEDETTASSHDKPFQEQENTKEN